MIDFAQIFELTINRFGLTASAISKESGVGVNTLSNFRRGKSSMTVDNMSKLLEALPMEARTYYLGLLNQQLMTGAIVVTNTYSPGDRVAPDRTRAAATKTNSKKKPAKEHSKKKQVAQSGVKADSLAEQR